MLPPEFDADIISSSFEDDEPGPKRALNHANQKSTAELTEFATPLTREMSPPEEQTGLADGLEGGADQAPETNNRPDVPNAADSDIAGADPYSDRGVQLDQSGARWHDGTFTKEIMTPYLRLSGNYLSDMSIAALEDIGYGTVYCDNIDIA